MDLLAETIAYEDFAKLDIRIGTVLAAEHIPDTDKLLKCTVDFGTVETGGLGTRTIVSGIATFRTTEQIVGKQLPYIVNLAPRMLRGVESQGMLLAASPGGDGLALLIPDTLVPNGTKLK
jgi:methionyl-tRNA synthetase